MNAIAELYRRALHCRVCFDADPELRAPIVDLAQPRWIGPRYWDAKPRIAFVLTNPGAGGSSHEVENRMARELLVGFRDGVRTFADVLKHQGGHMPAWGKTAGKFLNFYTTGLGLALDDIAFHNIALCATEGNDYPTSMLRRCFEAHSGGILRQLNPEVVILSGVAAQAYESSVKWTCPDASVLGMLHYAHREGSDTELAEQARIRGLLEGSDESADQPCRVEGPRSRVGRRTAPGRVIKGSEGGDGRDHKLGESILVADPRRSIEILDELVALGFTDHAFQLLHHSRSRGWRDTIAGYRAYCGKVSSFRKNGDPERDHRRLEFVLREYRRGGYEPGLAEVFANLANTAFEQMPPLKTTM